MDRANRKTTKVEEAWKVVIEHRRADLIKRLRAYDNRNHRGKYALLCREAADFLELEARHHK